MRDRTDRSGGDRLLDVPLGVLLGVVALVPIVFVAGAVLTPTPDMFNQTLMAGPLIILYEVGIIAARIFGKRKPAPEPAAAQGSA